jgi:hypothetical protein
VKSPASQLNFQFISVFNWLKRLNISNRELTEQLNSGLWT